MATDAPFSVLWKYLPARPGSQVVTDETRDASTPQAVKLRYLVTGTGRSGTVSLACALGSVGIYCSHERFFRGASAEDALALLEGNVAGNSLCSGHCGLPEWGEQVVAESSYLAAPHLAAPFLGATTIIHAVRDPWKVLPSFLNDIQFFRGDPVHEHERFIYAVLPHLHHLDSPVDRAAYYYIHWNLMIEWLGMRQAPARYIFHRVEDGPRYLLRQLAKPEPMGEVLPPLARNSFKDWPRDMKPKPTKRISGAQFLRTKYRNELCTLAERYGYDRFPNFLAEESAVEETPPEWAAKEKAFPPPLLVESGYRGFNLVLWKNTYYGLLQAMGPLDLQTAASSLLKDLADRGACVMSGSLEEAKEKVDRAHALAQPPRLVESGYRGFNLVLWRETYYGLEQAIGPLDLQTAAPSDLKELMDRGALVLGKSLDDARRKVDQAGSRASREYCGAGR